MKYSKNVKLNSVLTEIENQLLDFSIDEIKRYKKEFPHEMDYNIAQYGNLLIYYDELRDLYKSCGYKAIEKISNDRLWDTYKRQVGYIANKLL